MKRTSGISLVELVVVLSVIALGVSLSAPTIVAARQESRRAECTNGMRQIGQAWLDHEHAHGFLPSSGWGSRWTGDPDLGFGKNQPGGWGYDILRFTQYADVANRGAGLGDLAKGRSMLIANQAPIPFFHCPERRESRIYPVHGTVSFARNLPECVAGNCAVSRIDYRANSGNVAMGETSGPSGDRLRHETPTTSYLFGRNTGLTHQRSEFRLAQVSDGLSHTLCVGEKYLNPDAYLNGFDPSDDGSALIGLARDLNGYTASSTATEPRQPIQHYQPRRDRPGLSLPWTFGSAHAGGFNVVYLDASVRFVSYDIDFYAFYLLGGRSDDQ